MPAVRPIQSILVAVDLTTDVSDVLRSAGDLALASGAKLHVVHSHEEGSIVKGERELLVAQRSLHSKRAALMDVLAAHLPGTATVGSVRVQVGSAAEVILEEARTVAADVIILGAHRNRGIADRLLGSTAELVLRHAKVPCLILNSPLALPIERIVVPSDLSSPSRRALTTALGWARVVCPENGQISLTHVLDSSVEVETAPWTEQELQADLLAGAAEASRSAGTQLPIEAKVIRGDEPVEDLIDHAENIGAGLIVIGTHGDGMLVRALLGSVSSGMVRRSPLPVLLVPRTAADRGRLQALRQATAAAREDAVAL